jgi:hypothetical protein
MSTLVCLLEEPSARELLRGLLPRLVPAETEIIYLVFEGKQDLERNVTKKLQGWQRADSKFLVLRDQDAADCAEVKHRLMGLVKESGRTALVRVACRELEAWVVGDLSSVATELDRPEVASEAGKAKFRDPDALVHPVEELRRLIQTYQKIEGARRMGPLLDPTRNCSPSFRAFCAGIQRICPPRRII